MKYPGWFVKRFAMEIFLEKKSPHSHEDVFFLEEIWANIGMGRNTPAPIFHVYYGHVIVRTSPGTFRPIRILDDLSDSIHLKINAFIHHSITI